MGFSLEVFANRLLVRFFVFVAQVDGLELAIEIPPTTVSTKQLPFRSTVSTAVRTLG